MNTGSTWFAYAAFPIAGIVGGPLSGVIMGSTGGRLDLANWQWLFLLERLPSIGMGLLTLRSSRIARQSRADRPNAGYPPLA